MSKTVISGVLLTPLLHVTDSRGAVKRMMRHGEPPFERFGEIYFSTVHEGIIKAWRRHTRVTSNLAVPIGAIRFVLFDARQNDHAEGPPMIVELGDEHYQLLTVPPGIWIGWQGLGTGTSLVANCATEPHDPAEAERAPLDAAGLGLWWPDGLTVTQGSLSDRGD